MLQKRLLIIRFSSFGDIVQTSFCAQSFNGLTDLVTKKEFSKSFDSHFEFETVYSYDKSTGLKGLWQLAKKINLSDYSLIYDAHNNQRTLLLKFFLFLLNPLNFFKFKTRSKFRLKRFLLFRFKWNLFPKPFKGANSFLHPLKLNIKKIPSKKFSKKILLAPSASWELKRWPAQSWIGLGNSLIQKGYQVSYIGGPEDTFIEDICAKTPGAVNLAGKLSWEKTIDSIKESGALISGDTGALHIADYFGVPAIMLAGPSAFGFPSRESTTVINKNLPCQPCSKDGRGKCKNKIYQKCMTDIRISDVLRTLEAL